MLYYLPNYISSQPYQNHFGFENDKFEVHFDLTNGAAKSLPFSPFGGFRIKDDFTTQEFLIFLKELKNELTFRGIKRMQVTQPPHYYASFVNESLLVKAGFEKSGLEYNQYVDLKEKIDLHEMQQRKLRQSTDLEFSQVDLSLLAALHSFIDKCRVQQGLQINISSEKLKTLWQELPDSYEGYVVKLKDEIICAVIMALVNKEICYYYLPATDEQHKKLSPMVFLLDQLYSLYKTRGFKIMDLGISSIDGQKQAGLFQFKQRMGALSTEKVTFTLDL